MLKTLNIKNRGSLKILETYLEKRKLFQKSQTKAVSQILKNVKKNFRKLKRVIIKYFFQKKK